jgi:hypothetical protein
MEYSETALDTGSADSGSVFRLDFVAPPYADRGYGFQFHISNGYGPIWAVPGKAASRQEWKQGAQKWEDVVQKYKAWLGWLGREVEAISFLEGLSHAPSFVQIIGSARQMADVPLSADDIRRNDQEVEV